MCKVVQCKGMSMMIYGCRGEVYSSMAGKCGGVHRKYENREYSFVFCILVPTYCFTAFFSKEVHTANFKFSQFKSFKT